MTIHRMTTWIDGQEIAIEFIFTPRGGDAGEDLVSYEATYLRGAPAPQATALRARQWWERSGYLDAFGVARDDADGQAEAWAEFLKA